MQLTVIVTLDVEDDTKTHSVARIRQACVEAVTNAMKYAQGEGHVHSLQEDVSMMLASVREG